MSIIQSTPTQKKIKKSFIAWMKLIIRVPSAGWRIREIPDCASSPKTHLYSKIRSAKSKARVIMTGPRDFANSPRALRTVSIGKPDTVCELSKH